YSWHKVKVLCERAVFCTTSPLTKGITLKSMSNKTFLFHIAGWSSLAARWAHNPKVGGSNPSPDRKSTRLNSSHVSISYAVFCLKKKTSNNSAILITNEQTQ